MRLSDVSRTPVARERTSTPQPLPVEPAEENITMPLSQEQLDNWFTYHPPTEETQPKYDAITAATVRCSEALLYVLNLSVLGADGHDVVNRETRTLAEVIDTNAPDCADKTAAIRCVRIARNAANEVVRAKASGLEYDYEFLDLMIAELHKARWQANAAIACGGR